MTPTVKAFFDPETFTVTYLVSDPETAAAVIIDPVLDYDGKSGRSHTGSADKLMAYVKSNALTVDLILETHIHADHLSAAIYLRDKLGAKIGVSDQVYKVQETFKKLFNAGDDFQPDGSQFDVLLADGDSIALGNMTGQVMYTPGHTQACISFVFGDSVFVGDTLFMPDYGSARCDFPGGDAASLYASIRRILELPAETTVFTCHDYGAEGRDFAWASTVAEQRENNIHINDGVSQDDFVAMREGRDADLAVPVLLLPSVQVNMRAGNMPAPDDNGISYLKIPLNTI
ncbi:MAG: MBL fold metallo-hydrolase [Rhodospirillaceae bacterium]|jgi:glyoxylase-like metal-dependent hydrolase (beta-lactamase superfamily II)|nr:MBL fold metallo-hydrolase [Rhodospirillaceae bacterium]MBT5244845.1 MBL fold metallo-hydrolase [Rhodospirillaceae bacterium]MBT5563626.1 MBL fold metallo-hydrolase [Rhodospirillaceae bacterium]MBT6241456.1 MBL fold metallo-hydrolase [Rhodospirillaceae bacterium]MBT7138841.1 MBL fold metallo-hydrolase [Rhodospirillaceae bacterium]